MESVLKTNIEREMQARGLKKLTELERLCGVPYRTLQDIMYEKVTARINTVAAIASGLGISPGKLLEDPDSVAQPVESESNQKSREALLVSLLEKALKLDDNALSVVLGFIETRYGAVDLKKMSKLENK